jgi:hypothetical protein
LSICPTIITECKTGQDQSKGGELADAVNFYIDAVLFEQVNLPKAAAYDANGI